MKFLEIVSMSLRNIFLSKTRTLLTMLGIIIGVAAVIVIVGLGNGLEQYITDSFSELGTNTLTVSVIGRGNSTRSISVEEMYDIAEENTQYFLGMSPTVLMDMTVKIGTDTANDTAVTGVSEDYLSMKEYDIAEGRGIQYNDIAQRKQVCVVGAYLNQAYFGGRALGETIKIGGNTFTIAGVLVQQADELEEGGADDAVYLPYSTAARLSGLGNINSYLLVMAEEDLVAESVETVENALYEKFEDEDAYMVTSMSEMLDSMTSMVNTLVLVLVGIAAISLLVGGIGIMNIMLVSVTERTREIGIRKSLGAKERYIMQQFVVEAAVTSALGGLLGIVIGFLLSAVASKVVAAALGTALTISPSAGAVLTAFGISAGIGVLFGYLPAKKAAKLNPIDALHYD